MKLWIAGLRGPIGTGGDWRQFKMVAVGLVSTGRAWRVGCCEGKGGDNPSCCDADQRGAERAAHKQARKPPVLLGMGHGKSPRVMFVRELPLSDHRRKCVGGHYPDTGEADDGSKRAAHEHVRKAVVLLC